MSMPANLVLLRHGESEGNIANKLSRAGDDSLFTDVFRNRHSSLFRLTDRGRDQAKTAGAWIRKNIGNKFFRYYTSEYVRAKETAALLALPDARWFADFYLRERDWGALDVMPHHERRAKFSEELRRQTIDPFFWAPPSGESMASLCIRVDRVLETLHRECEGEDVIVVCHGEVMWAFRMRLERMSQERYHELDASSDVRDSINNCQVLQYTRIDPGTRKLTPYLGWMRSVCPSDLSRSRNVWEAIERPRYTNAELLAMVEKYERLVS